MIGGLLFSFCFPVAVGLVAVRYLWPSQLEQRSSLLVQLPLALGIGLGFSSCLYFLYRSSPLDARALLPAEASLFLLSLVLLWKRLRRPTIDAGPQGNSGEPRDPAETIVMLAWLAALTIALTAFICLTLGKPHGGWDAWAIWNLRARFIYRGGTEWTRAFTPLLAWSHPDYPLLVPGSVARSWTYAGTESLIAPALLAGSFTFATAFLLTGSLALARSRTQGYLAGLVLLATPFFVRHGASQYADVPLGFFLLAALVLLYLSDCLASGAPGLLVAAGACAALTAWTKNEGLLCFAALTATRPLARLWLRRSREYLSELPWYAAGAVPVLATIAYFKLEFATANDLLSSGGLALGLERATDLFRYQQILGAFAAAFLSLGGWKVSLVALLALYGLCLGRTGKRESRQASLTATLTLGAIIVGYCIPYLASPYDLRWHLATSASRLVLQLWPSFLFAFFVVVRSPREALPGAKASF